MASEEQAQLQTITHIFARTERKNKRHFVTTIRIAAQFGHGTPPRTIKKVSFVTEDEKTGKQIAQWIGEAIKARLETP